MELETVLCWWFELEEHDVDGDGATCWLAALASKEGFTGSVYVEEGVAGFTDAVGLDDGVPGFKDAVGVEAGLALFTDTVDTAADVDLVLNVLVFWLGVATCTLGSRNT